MESKQLYLIHRNKHREAAKLRGQRNMAQIKEQNKTPEKELNEKEIANLSDAEFKTLVIKMLRELRVWPQHKARNEGHTKWNKNLLGTNSEGEEARIQINDLEHKEEISIQPKQQEEKNFFKWG